MKIINEKGKLFGLINPIDLILLICIVVVAVAIVLKSALPNPTPQPEAAPAPQTAVQSEPVVTAPTPNALMTIKMRVRGVMPYLEEQALKIEAGEKLVAGNNFVNDAKIVSVESVPFASSAATDKGEYVFAEDDNRSDLIVTIKALQILNDNTAMHVVAAQEVRVGRAFVIRTRDFELNATVESIDIDKENVNVNEF